MASFIFQLLISVSYKFVFKNQTWRLCFWQDSSEANVACHILSGKLDFFIQQAIPYSILKVLKYAITQLKEFQN